MPPSLDPLLTDYFRVSDEKERSDQLELLAARAEPVIRGVIRRRWPAARDRREQQAVEDLYSEVLVQLLSRLEEERERSDGAGPPEQPIRDFLALAATITTRTCDGLLRQRYPERARLKRRLEYVLTREKTPGGLSLWTGPDGRRLAGLAAWAEDRVASPGSRPYRTVLDAPRTAIARRLAGRGPEEVHPVDLLHVVFEVVQGPVLLDDLVRVVAELWGVQDHPQEELDAGGAAVPSGGKQPFEAVAEQETLRSLWAEIRQLPAHQCAALLLNLRDAAGHGLIGLLPIRRIATLSELASAMGLRPARLAELWNGLPMDDLTIAEMLGCTRQQVINYRRSARERLARKMAPHLLVSS